MMSQLDRLNSRLRPWVNWRRKRFWLLAALLAWTLFGFFGTPPLVQRAMTQAVEGTGREFQVADVNVNPFALSLRIEELEIGDPDGTAVTRFDELYVNFQLSSIFRRAWTFDTIRLTRPHVEEERFADGGTRLQRLAEDLAGPPREPEAQTKETAPTRLVIHDLVLEDGRLGITDQLASGYHAEFGPIDVAAQNISTLPDHAGENEVSIGMPGGGLISWRGDLQLVPLSSTGKLTVRGEGLPAILRYADHFLPVELEGRELDVNLDYSLKMQQNGLSIAAQNWNLRTSGISARMDGADEAFLKLREIALNGGRWRWPEKTVHAEALNLDGLDLLAWLDAQGNLNLLDALAAEGSAAADSPDVADPGWQVSVGKLAVQDASVDFEDRTVPTPASLRFEDLSLTLSEVDNQEGTQMPAELSLKLASGGEVSYSGSVVALPEIRLDGQATVSGLVLPVLQPWLAQQAHLELLEGTLRLEADVTGIAPDALVLTGSAGVSGLELLDARRDQRLAALQSLAVERFELDVAGASLKTSVLDLQGGYGRIHIFEDQSTNLDGLAVDAEESPAEAPDPSMPPVGEDEQSRFAITVGGIEVRDGSLDFADDSLPLPFQAAIRAIDGTLSTLATASTEPSSVKLEGRVNEFGEARIEGTISPWDFTRNTDIDVIFRNLQMATLTPYTVQYAGYAIEGGRLDMDLRYTLDQRQLKGENSIVIRELVLGDKVEHPNATSLPLKLAVALLKDSEGVIDVDLPVSGDLDDPAFEITGIIWKAIGNLITRVVTSPFRFLAGLVGVDSEDFGTLSFSPGRADVSPPDREQLLKLADAMHQRPELSLVVKGVYDEALDLPALKEQAFEVRFEAARAERVESGEVGPIQAEAATLESLFMETFPETSLESIQAEHLRPPATASQEAGTQDVAVLDQPAYLNALRERLIEAREIGEAELRELATRRAENVVGALHWAGGEKPLAVRFSGEVERGEAEEGSVTLELEVAVQ